MMKLAFAVIAFAAAASQSSALSMRAAQESSGSSNEIVEGPSVNVSESSTSGGSNDPAGWTPGSNAGSGYYGSYAESGSYGSGSGSGNSTGPDVGDASTSGVAGTAIWTATTMTLAATSAVVLLV